MAGVDLGSIVAHLKLEMSDFNNNLNKAAQQLQNTQNNFKGFDKLGQTFTSVGKTLTTGITMPVMAIGASVVKTQMQFEDSMAKVKALSGATGEEFKKLEDTAKKYGETTVFSASECADALGYMALAGWDANESAAGLPGVLNLAAASGMELAQASDLVTDYLTAFGLEADQAGRMADVLSYAQANSNTTTEQLGEAFKNCAVNAHNAGMTLEETTAILGKLADSGLKGSEAGTALNAVIRDMTSKMKDGNIQIGNTKVAVQDANGNFRDMTDIIADVSKATEGMGDAERTAALQSTFTADSIKAMGIMCNTGADDINKFTNELEHSKGSAQEMSDTMNNTLSGAIKELGSAWEALQLSLGGSTGVLTGLVKALTQLVLWVKNLPDPIKQVITTLALLLAAIGPISWGIGKLMFAFGKLKDSITMIKKGFDLLKTGFLIFKSLLVDTLVPFITGTVVPALQGLWAILIANPIILVVAAIAALVAAFIYAWNNIDGFKEFWINLWETIKTKAIEGWNAVVNFFTVSMPQWFNSVVQWFKELPAKLWYYLCFAVAYAVLWTGQMIQKGKQAGSKFVQNVINFIKQLPSKIKTYFSLAVTYARKWLHDMTQKAKETGTKFINGVITFIKQLPGKVWSFLTQTIQKAISFATQFAQKGMQAARDFASKIKNGLANLPGQMVTIGKNIIQGIVRGVTSGARNLYNSMRNIASKALNAAKEKLGIHSPSRVFANEVGKYIPEGITVGIRASADNTLKTLKNFADSLVTTINTDDFMSQVNLATSGINIQANGDNSKLQHSIDRLYALIESKNNDFDYKQMGQEFKQAAQSISGDIIMDKIVVGQKVARTVDRVNGYYKDQQERFRGDKDFV